MSTELIDVQMPDGTIVSGVPKGTTQAEVLRRYSLSKQQSLPSIEDRRAAAKAAFEANLPTLPNAVNEVLGMVGKIVTPVGKALLNTTGDTKVSTGMEPTGNRMLDLARGAFGSAMPGAGNMTTVADAVSQSPLAEITRAVMNRTSPDLAQSLMRRGQNNLVVTKEVGPAIPTDTGSAIRATAQIARGPIRRTIGNTEVAAAKFLAPSEASGNLIVPLESGAGETVAAPRSAGSDQFVPQSPVRSVPEPAPLNIPRPTTPKFIQDILDRFRTMETPEELYARQQAVRNMEFAPEPQAGPTPTPTPYKPPPDTGLPSTAPSLDAPALNRAMNISERQVSRGADPGKRILGENLLAPTPAQTKVNVDAALAQSGAKLRAALEEAKSVKIDAQTPVYDALTNVDAKLRTPTDAAFQGNVNSVLDKIESRYPNLNALTPEQTQALKIEVGDSINWHAADSDPLNDALIKLYRDLNASLKDSVPGIAEEQLRWGDLYNASKGLKKTLDKEIVGRSLWNKFMGQH